MGVCGPQVRTSVPGKSYGAWKSVPASFPSTAIGWPSFAISFGWAFNFKSGFGKGWTFLRGPSEGSRSLCHQPQHRIQGSTSTMHSLVKGDLVVMSVGAWPATLSSQPFLLSSGFKKIFLHFLSLSSVSSFCYALLCFLLFSFSCFKFPTCSNSTHFSFLYLDLNGCYSSYASSHLYTNSHSSAQASIGTHIALKSPIPCQSWGWKLCFTVKALGEYWPATNGMALRVWVGVTEDLQSNVISGHCSPTE